MQVVDPSDLIRSKCPPGSVAWGDPQHLIDLLETTPHNLTLLARGGQKDRPTAASASVAILEDGNGGRRLAMRSSWPEGDPADHARQLHELALSLGGRYSSPAITMGSAVGRVLSAYLTRNGRRHPGYWPDTSARAFRIARHLRGGLQLAPKTYLPDAMLLDIVGAYAWSMSGFLPEGQPIQRTLSRAALPRAGRGASQVWVDRVTLDTSALERPVLLWSDRERPMFPRVPALEWCGTLEELGVLLEAGARIASEDADVSIYRPSQFLAGLLERMKADLFTPLFKAAYKAIWPKFLPGAGWVGRIAADPSYLPDRLWRKDFGHPSLWWSWDSLEGKMAAPGWQLCRPELAAWIPGRVRARMVPLVAGHECAQVLVDALVVPATVGASLVSGTAPGDLREVARGDCLSAGPGQYAIGDRLKLCGTRANLQSLEGLRDAAVQRCRVEGADWQRIEMPGIGWWPDARFGWEKPRQRIGGR